MSVRSRVSWLLLNIAFAAVVYSLGTIHDRRVVYADKVLLHLVKYVLLHAVVFVVLLSFACGAPPWKPLTFFYTFVFISLAAWWIVSRKMLKWYRRQGYNYRRIIVVGGGDVGKLVMDELASDLGYGYRIMGFFDDDEQSRQEKSWKGRIDEIDEFLDNNIVDELYCAVPDAQTHSVRHLITTCEKHAIDFYYAPHLGPRVMRRFQLETIGNVPIMAIRPYPLNNPLNKLVKRVFDLVFSIVALALSSVLFVPIAIAVKLSSPGPVFFKQRRTGYRGQPFYCYKFRTMRVNDESDTSQTAKDDPRKTRVGNFLRKTSLDELPQFFNVLIGDMSIVGPRPHMEAHTQIYSDLIEQYMLRHTIKPGITGWAQVNGYRGATEELWMMEKRVEHDVWYTENWNFMLDIKIIFLTIINIFRGEKNAF